MNSLARSSIMVNGMEVSELLINFLNALLS